MATAPDIDAPANPLATVRAEVREWIAANFPPELKGKDNAMSAVEGPHTNSPDGRRLAKGDGREGLGGADLAEGIWRRRAEPRPRRGCCRKRCARRRLEPDRRDGRDDVRPDAARIWHRRTEARAYPGDRQRDGALVPGLFGAGRGIGSRELQTFAEDHGDHYVVNGQKTWTSGGQWADKCFMLVRTDKSKKHEGITFLLCDMDTPGVEVKPIQLISGSSPFCETFFTDVKVPKENRVGAEGEGWTIGKRLLQHERSSLSGGGSTPGGCLPGRRWAARQGSSSGVDEQGRIADADLRTRIVRHEMDLRAFMLTLRRASLEAKSNQGPSARDFDHEECRRADHAGALRAADRDPRAGRARLGRRGVRARTSCATCAHGSSARRCRSMAGRPRSRTT
jgi:hypothetical protein